MSDIKSGTRIGNYEVVSPVTHGGMASLFAVRRHDLDGFERLFALKAMHPHLARDENFIDMFKDEAAISARVQHSNVVQVFETGVHEGLPYLVMEMLQGETLFEVLKTSGGLDVPSALFLLSEVANGLHAAHTAKDTEGAPLEIVHRDVNPTNIHIGYDGAVHLLDFGVASARHRRTFTRTGEIKGKTSYLAPEQISKGGEASHRIDLFALGVTAWETLTGRRLFSDENDGQTMWNVLYKPIPDVAELCSDIPGPVAKVIMQCLQRDPAARPGSAGDLVAAFASGAGSRHDLARRMDAVFPQEERTAISIARKGVEPSSRSAPPKEAVPSPASAPSANGRRKAVLATVGIVAVLGLALTGWMSTSPQTPESSPPVAPAEREPTEPSSDTAPAAVRPVAVPTTNEDPVAEGAPEEPTPMRRRRPRRGPSMTTASMAEMNAPRMTDPSFIDVRQELEARQRANQTD